MTRKIVKATTFDQCFLSQLEAKVLQRVTASEKCNMSSLIEELTKVGFRETFHEEAKEPEDEVDGAPKEEKAEATAD